MRPRSIDRDASVKGEINRETSKTACLVEESDRQEDDLSLSARYARGLSFLGRETARKT